jgi:RNA polymerase-binding transcription factor DksA
MRLLADRVGDAEDESVTDLLVDLDLAEIDRDLEELRDVEAALGRIREQSYGVCVGCGGAVPFERLRAYPTAKRCLRCQGAREKTFVHRATPSL